MKEKNNIKFKIIVFLLIALGIGSEFYPYKKVIQDYREYKKRIAPYTADREVFYPDGVLKYKKEGKKEEYYHRNGALRRVEENSKADIRYDIGGNVIERFAQEESKVENGVDKIYSVNGNIVAESNYKNGKLDGSKKIYFIDSKDIFAEENYRDGMKVGEQKYYFKNGDIEIYEKYDENGKLKIKNEFFFSGEPKSSYDFTEKNRRESVEYNEDTKKIKEKEIILYSDNEEILEEIKERYNENGVKKYTTKEVKKSNLEETNIYYENGNLQYTYYELFGKRMPVGKIYYKNGNLDTNNYYDETNKKLISEKYFENGKLESKTIYENKEMISDIEYYIEYRNNGKKFYEVKKVGDKKIEKFYGKTEKLLYENVIEGDK